MPTINVGAVGLPAAQSPLNINGNTGGATRVEISGPAGDDGVSGLVFAGGSEGSIARKLVINGFGEAGVHLAGTSAITLTGLWIGLDETGLATVPGGNVGVLFVNSGDSLVGGLAAGTRNVISGHDLHGIQLSNGGLGGNNVIRGNYLGTNKDGIGNLGNVVSGVNLGSITASDEVEHNVIGGSQFGVRAGDGSSGGVISSNRIGIDVQGGAIPNGTGVAILQSAHGFDIFQNFIDHNTGLGIDLGGDGVTPNDTSGPDTDDGPNGLLNFPVLTRADVLTTSTLINGRLRTSPNIQAVIDLFLSPACDPSGYGEGAERFAFAVVLTDAAGKASFSIEYGDVLPVGQVVTGVTRTAADGASEFSACETVIA